MQHRTSNLRLSLQEGKGVCPSVPQGVEELSKSSIATSKHLPHTQEQQALSQYISPFERIY